MISLDTTEGANLLNVQYGVCFGVIFTFCFKAASGPNGNDVSLALPLRSSAPFALLLLYFFLDWGLANFLRDRIRFSLVRTVEWSLGIWFLGCAVVLAPSASDLNKYALLGMYAATVGLYQFISYYQDIYAIPSGRRMFGMMFVAPAMLLAGTYLLYHSVLCLAGLVHHNSTVDALFLYVIIACLLLKLFNILNLASAALPLRHPSQQPPAITV